MNRLPKLLLALPALLAFAGCVGIEDMPPARAPGGDPRFANVPDRDRVLTQYRLAATAMRTGDFDEAKKQLDDALQRMGGLISGPDDAAKRARGLFTAEREKTFIGEPYERVMAYYYRGLLYWRDGQPDNARACFRSAEFIDADAEDKTYQSDYVLLDYLDGLATTKLSGDGSDARARAEKVAKHALPAYDPAANVLCFVEFGSGPRKVAAGEYGEQLKFQFSASRVRSASLAIGDQTLYFTPWDSLNFQALTRGGRVMDHVLGNKAVFKRNTDVAGDIALAGSAIAADNVYKEKKKIVTDEKGRKREVTEVEKDQGNENLAIGLGILGVASKIFSAATETRADTRTWDNLPQYLSFAAVKLPPGEHPALLQFFYADGRPIEDLTRRVALTVTDPARDTVIFLSEQKR
jgi:tetratricopeptide (TPR) repeat protein